MSDETYYTVLNVKETASASEIKAAYRDLIKQVHPDTITNLAPYMRKIAEDKAKEITEAYNELSNASRRREYDRQLARSDIRTHHKRHLNLRHHLPLSRRHLTRPPALSATSAAHRSTPVDSARGATNSLLRPQLHRSVRLFVGWDTTGRRSFGGHVRIPYSLWQSQCSLRGSLLLCYRAVVRRHDQT
jgi:curved DNA-binding protein CbpA